MIYALIDMGSNTIRLNIYKCKGSDVNLLFTTKDSAGLVGYVKDGVLSQKGINKACNVLNKFNELIKNFEIDQLKIFATASLRNINNTEDVLKFIEKKTGLRVDVISGEDEAVFDFIGATKVVNVKDGVLIDIGGGSTELVAFEDGKIIHALSIPIGSLKLYKRYVSHLFPKKKEMKKIKKMVYYELDKIKKMDIKPYKIICGVGGSVRAARKLNNAIFELPDIDAPIKVKNLNKILNLLSRNYKESLDIILQVVPDRIHTIIPGLIILNVISEFFKSESIIVSNSGVREGYLYGKVLKGESKNGKNKYF
ncbi:MAG: phosphatase [Eubacteriaceae bacterium]